MGADWYCRAHGDALFELVKPLSNCGIGIDALPESIRNSHHLSGNELGKLGNIVELPDAEWMKTIRDSVEESERLKTAKQFLLEGKTREALALIWE